MADEKLIFPIGFDLEEGVAQVEKDWGKMQKKLQDTFKSQTIQVDADISKAVLDKLYAKFEGLIKTMESKAPQIKLKIPDTVDFEQEINRLKVQLKSINLGELTDAESKDLYLYIRQLEALAKALKEVNKQEQLRQANRPEVIALRQAQAEEKRTRAIANSALAEQRRAKIATESARQAEINNRSAQRSAVIAEQKRAATARAEQAELRLTRAKERSTQATHEQNTAYKTQGGYLSRLFQRMVAYASVAQAFSFVRNVRDVTAEFELQRVALGSIIGDLNEANAMFEQIKAAAVKSPFQIKELVTYTKQLAAYKIESDELFETTQKLADVSAGLGVGMERLVLAYGQIRATGYLRASEVRQLTEAGIPIVEELAKKMSQLRGETVSAAEVMGLISERAISFGMVKEVFDDMTSAGGMFYKMQEKQAETLRGQWNNLKDSIAIMYAEIGNTEGVNNSIKGTIGLVKTLAENWRDVYSVAQSLSVAMGVYYVAMKNATVASKALSVAEATRLSTLRATTIYMPKFLASTKLAITLTRAYRVAVIKSATATGLLSKAFWGLTKAMLSNPYTAVLAALAGITFAIVKFATKTKTTQERIDDLNKSVASLTDLKDDVKPLVDELDALSQKTNKTAEEQKRLNQVTQELADKYPSTITAVREYGKEVDITAGKVRELYEAELKAKTVGLRAELEEDEKALKKLREKYDAIRAKQIKGTKTKYVGDHEFDYTMEEVPLTTKELAKLNEETRKLEEEMRPLEQSIHDAKVALGDIAPEATRAIEAFGSWKQTIKDFKTGLKNDLGEDIKLFDDDIINQFTSLNDALDSVAEQYNKNDEAIKRYTQTLTSKKLTQAERKDIEDKKARATAFRDTASAILDYYNARSLLNQGKGGNEGESELSILQKELRLHEKIYAKYKEYRKYMSDEQARAKVEDYFGDTIKSLMFEPKYDSQGFKQVLKQYQDYARTLPDSEKVVLDIGFKVEDIDWQDTKTELEDSLKNLSDQISRTKTAKEFFDRMLGMTGDKELSATLTLSVYGTTGDDLQRLMSKQVEDAFKNLPEGFDITKAMLGGGKFDYNLLESWIEKLPEQDRKSAQSIVENWRKTNQDIITDLYKTYEEFLSFEERKTRVVEKENAERMRIINSGLPMAEQEKLIGASQKREQKSLADIAIEEFKASADWAKSFEDLEHLATPTIERLMAKLKEFIDTQKDLTPEQLKTLTNEYKKLYEGLITRNPFQALTDGIKEYQQARDEVITAGIGVETAKANVETTQEELRIASERKAIAEQNFRTSTDTARAGREYAEAIKLYNQAAENASKAEQALTDAERNQTDAMDNQRKAYSKIEKSLDGIQNKFLQAEQLVQSFTEILGISEDSDFGAFLNGMAESFGGVAKAIAFAQLAMQLFDGTIKTFLTSNPIGWILLIVSAIISAVQAIMNVRVKRIDREIERLQDRLDQLEYSYERLQKAQEKAFGSDYISNYEQRLANLQAQQDAYLKQADAERSKGKKADSDKIKEYEEQARETADAIKDMQSELSEYFLGTDITSAARDFANAWIDAYKEFGSTTDAMKEKFQDMIQNMIVESFAAKVIQSALSDIFTEIDNMTKDGVLDVSEASKIADMTEVAVGNIDVGMTNLMNALSQAGISVRGMGSDLTGISRDIATASEESILGLAAGINTQNFYISQVPTKLDTIIGLLRGGSAVVDSGVNVQDLITIQNQFLSHLPTIAQNTAETVARCERAAVACESMASKLGSVIKPKGTTSTHSVNVTIGS